MVLRTLLEVRAGQRDPDALDGIVDWDSLALDSGLSSSAPLEEQRQEAMTRRVLGREPLPPEMVYPMLAMFDVKVESDRAAVYDRQRGKRVYRLFVDRWGLASDCFVVITEARFTGDNLMEPEYNEKVVTSLAMRLCEYSKGGGQSLS